MPREEEQREAHAPEGDELGVRGGHTVALAVDAGGALLLDEALEGEVETLAGELTGEGEANLGLARRVYEGCVDDAEGLGEQGEVGAEEGEFVVGVLFGGLVRLDMARAELSRNGGKVHSRRVSRTVTPGGLGQPWFW